MQSPARHLCSLATSFMGAFVLVTLTTPAQPQSAERVPRTIEFHFDGLHHAPDGYLYFCGSWKGSKVYRATPSGEVEVYAEGPFDGPTDAVMDSRGNLYVSNYNSTYISIITPEREVRRFAETPLGPAGMAIDGDDNLYVTIYGTPAGEGHSILRITPSGETSTYAEGPELHASVGLAVDDRGVVYVLNGREARIFRIPSVGRIEPLCSLPLARGVGGGAHLDWAGGHLYASSGIGAVYRITPNGTVHYLLVEGTTPRPQGPATSPLLANSNGLTATSDGNTLYLGCRVAGEPALVRVNDAAPEPTPQAGWNALRSGDLPTARQIFEVLARTEPVAPRVWYGLGTLLYRDGVFDEAAALFALAAEAPALRAAASYDRACSLARLGKVDAALDALEVSIAAGFANAAHLRNDADLVALRVDPRWAEITDKVEAAATRGAR